MANLSPLLTLVLILCSVLICAARPEPTFPAAAATTASPVDRIHQEKKIEGNRDDVAEESCGVEDEDCLMRRTLAAHLDYIYTQKKHP
ncbi:PREDICTED: phytosulfokines 2-like [Tarenaya hassleriana]|uniref:phytosulfokines 2-like n=1 Tax=Tarenaya hassleriana TaxID=28532 RepID=UPI00053C97F6|nr:PREDICTED: phytosulfokines 2-like [Tarenaya hassleriana]